MLALRGGPGNGLSLLAPPEPFADTLRAAADGEWLPLCNRGGTKRAWLAHAGGAHIAAGQPDRCDSERYAWCVASPRLADGKDLLIGVDECGWHVRLRSQILLTRRSGLARLHQMYTDVSLRIYRAGTLSFVCFLHPKPAIADSFCTLHL